MICISFCLSSFDEIRLRLQRGCPLSDILYENKLQPHYLKLFFSTLPSHGPPGWRKKKSFDKIKFDTNCICSQGGDIETFSQE